MDTATPAAFRAAAETIGCTVATIRAVFAVEASGRFFTAKGALVRRFEPHHFPREHWARLGFSPGERSPWRAAKRIGRARRAAMYAQAERIDAEAAARASSWGAPQIMGFNAVAAGYPSALDMVRAMERGADEQVAAFARLVVAKGADAALRASDWHTFAVRYNGSGQPAAYAAKVESAFRREAGRASPRVLSLWAQGRDVAAAQAHLVAAGYEIAEDAVFGPETQAAVIAFQEREGLAVDGVIGARTWAALDRVARAARKTAPKAAPLPKPRAQDSALDRLVGRAGELVVAPGAVGTATSAALGRLGETGTTLLVAGVVIAGLGVLAVWAVRELRRPA